ncbi:hypothetical protein EX30DRAFT_93777 [Ascodesmis nigricans]|uniref:t-SNARE coiled-coil homology domain-containing protein n=1 Tax=Ascodesmis nigricans TaxID=341454 RepID=A0A4S2N3Q9_9PEZI|nr:hypothetical protein EX30DRAFT_93777 [Ascodesmis nigricans]
MASRYSHNRNSTPYASSSASASSTPNERYSRAPYQNPYSTYSGGYGYSGGGTPGEAGGVGVGGYRAATPNRKGQYSTQVLEELESQNDEQVDGLSKKVRMLKDITVAIGEEVRSSTSLMEAMNDQFEGTRRKLRGTVNRMMVMAQKTGVGWKAWVVFIALVVAVFFWVWI